MSSDTPRICVTHHHACDCREAHFAKRERELIAIRAELEQAKADYVKLVEQFVDRRKLLRHERDEHRVSLEGIEHLKAELAQKDITIAAKQHLLEQEHEKFKHAMLRSDTRDLLLEQAKAIITKERVRAELLVLRSQQAGMVSVPVEPTPLGSPITTERLARDRTKWIAYARQLQAILAAAEAREAVAIASFDEERQRAVREGERVLAAMDREAALLHDMELIAFADGMTAELAQKIAREAYARVAKEPE